MDQQNMQRLQGGQDTYDYNQWRQHKQAGFTPFAALDKQAGISEHVTKWLTSGATKLSRGSQLSKINAGRAGRSGYTGGAEGMSKSPEALEAMSTAAKGVGNKRQGLADAMGNVGLKIQSSPGLSKTLDYGVPAVAGGGALYGSNRLGHSSGREQGVGEGYDVGSEVGMQAALNSQPGDPGVIGRILNVFRGQQQGPDAGAIQNLLEQSKGNILQTILSGKV